MSVEPAANSEVSHLRAIDDEYRVTLKVLAVVTERLLRQTGGTQIVIDDQALMHSPDLIAARGMLGGVVLSVSR